MCETKAHELAFILFHESAQNDLDSSEHAACIVSPTPSYCMFLHLNTEFEVNNDCKRYRNKI